MDQEYELNLIRELLVRLVDYHRANCPDAACCEPHNMMGFLLHAAGVRVSELHKTREYLADYESRCENCSHLRN